ncbi:MAG: YigZ family protein, partial [Clostridiales bacterium]|nr:YigZ family protein [Clostridiales bacterium]
MEPILPPFLSTLRDEGTAEFVQKKSRFVGYAAPAMTEADAEEFIADIRRRHPDASSLCWGYRVGPGGAAQRYHDDHEPSGGQPILEVLARRELNGAAAVARWFGGVKLGAGPLGRAFGRAAALAVEAAGLCRAELTVRLRVESGYGEAGALEHFLNRAGCRVERVRYEIGVVFDVMTRRDALSDVTTRVADITAGRG